jgi:hypothetical protein
MRASDGPEPERHTDRTFRPSIDDGFTLMLAGDLISSRPLAPKLASDPCFAAVARLLGEASLAIGNLETGIVYAGAGETLAHARAPRYVETEHGRVGLVSAYAAQKWDNDAALGQFGEVSARTRSSEYSPLIGSTFLNSSGYHCHSCRAGTQRNACTNAWSRRVPSPSTHP